MSEAENANIVGQEGQITEDWIQAKHKTSALIHQMVLASNPVAMDQWVKNRIKTSSLFVQARKEKLFAQFKAAAIPFSSDEDIRDVKRAMRGARKKLAALIPATTLYKIAEDPAPMDAPPPDLGSDEGAPPDLDAPLDDSGAGSGDMGSDPDMGAPSDFGGMGGAGAAVEGLPWTRSVPSRPTARHTRSRRRLTPSVPKRSTDSSATCIFLSARKSCSKS
jgi:hypothetical protein